MAGDIDPAAEDAVLAMQSYLAQVNSARIKASFTEETVFDDTHKIQFGGTVTLGVERPSRMFITARSDMWNRDYYLDNGAFVMFDHDVNVYATLSLPSKLRDAGTKLWKTYQMQLPGLELISEQGGELLLEGSDEVFYVGPAMVRGQKCHHLAGSMETMDWQLWIAASGDPLPVKYILTDLDIPLAPQFTIAFESWETGVKIPESAFDFQPPEGSEKIEVLLPGEE
jgi:hypothetical protein